MQIAFSLRAGIRIGAALAAAVCLYAQDQSAPIKIEGIPPRATPGDYQYHAQAGTVTVAAEFTGHSVATADETLTTEDYIAIETALYGPAGTRMKISHEDFSLRVNGKKTPLTSQPYGLVVKTLKNPELEPTASETKSKTSVGTGGGNNASDPPPPYRVPDDLRHAWGQKLQKEAFPEGERTLPQAGLIFFQYRGKTEKMTSIELTYTGPAGQVTIALQP